MTEAREKIANKINECPQEDMGGLADQILALEGEDWRIAVVEKRAKLPEIPEFQYDDEEYQPYLKRGAINYSKMLTRWVKEVEK